MAANVWQDPTNHQWYHRDETENEYGPYPTRELADDAFTEYCAVELDGKRPKAGPALETLILEFLELQSTVAELEEIYKDAKAHLKWLGENVLAEYMTPGTIANGVRLSDGREFLFDQKMNCGIEKEHRAAAHEWLDANGAGNLLKRTITIEFGKDSQKHAAEFRDVLKKILPQFEVSVRVGRDPRELGPAIQRMIDAGELKATLTEGTELPGATLSAWVRKQMTLGQTVPDLFGIFAPWRPVLAPRRSAVLSSADEKPAEQPSMELQSNG
jgi:hypothetical protein